MLGLSSPRFAYLTKIESKSGKGFLSLRRIEDLKVQLERAQLEGWDQSTNSPRQYSEPERKNALIHLEHLLQRSQPFAECVLPTPDYLDGYRMLSTDFTRLFGRTESSIGTPYLNAIPLGGGVCAQAVVFMATLLMHEQVRSILCPSDLPALVQDCFNRDVTSFEVSGFERETFANVLTDSRIGLNSKHELAIFNRSIIRKKASHLIVIGFGSKRLNTQAPSIVVRAGFGTRPSRSTTELLMFQGT